MCKDDTAVMPELPSDFKVIYHPWKSAQLATAKTNSSVARANSHTEENINNIALDHVLNEVSMHVLSCGKKIYPILHLVGAALNHAQQKKDKFKDELCAMPYI